MVGSLTSEERERYLAALTNGDTHYEACRNAQVNPFAVRWTMSADKAFGDKVRSVRQPARTSANKFTPEKKAKFIELMEGGETIAGASAAIDVNRETIRVHRCRDPEFDKKVKDLTVARGSPQFDDVYQEKFLEAVRKGNRPNKAAELVGFSAPTIRRHILDDKEFAEKVKAAEAESCEIVEDALWASALDGNFNAQKFWLINRAPDRWIDTKTTRQIGGDIIPIQVNVNNVFEDIKKLALDYETEFNNARKLAAGTRELATVAVVSERGGIEGIGLDGGGNPPEDNMGEQVHPSPPLSPAKEVPSV